MTTQISAVCSHNEWDPLEEVIVGSLDAAYVPEFHSAVEAAMPPETHEVFRKQGGLPFMEDLVAAAREELEGFVKLLEKAGVRVRRPDSFPFDRSFGTPFWTSRAGLYSAMPRDCLLVIGRDIIEAPMAWRSRYLETWPFRTLLMEYMESGARWVSAPKPQLRDSLYQGDAAGFAVNESEIVFDAADFSRCGRDIFAQRSHVTNEAAIAWLQSYLGGDYRVHLLEVSDDKPMHIDATFVPLGPRKVLINPDRLRTLPDMFSDWEVLIAPRPSARIDGSGFSMCSSWVVINLLMLDHRRVFVEATETGLIRFLEQQGFEPIPHSLLNLNRLGGGFHCCTLDIRRRGVLESYI